MTSRLDQGPRVALMDYQAGNLHSLGKALDRAGARVTITFSWQEALAHDAMVLPGVGAFGQASKTLPEDKTALRAALVAGKPCLGICLGMQLFFDGSAESTGDGIGLIPGRIERFGTKVVPQMGWNAVEASPDPVFQGVDPILAYYANSFVCRPEDERVIIGTSEHEDQRFAAAVRTANTWGFQFHPEKSSVTGLRVLANWVREVGRLVAAAKGAASEKPLPVDRVDRPE